MEGNAGLLYSIKGYHHKCKTPHTQHDQKGIATQCDSGNIAPGDDAVVHQVVLKVQCYALVGQCQCLF